MPPVSDLIHRFWLSRFFSSSVRDGVHAAVIGEGQEIPEEEICVCGHSASVHPDRKTGETPRDIWEISLTLKRENRSKLTFCCGFRSWRIVWFSLWPDVPSQPIVS